MLNVHCLKDRTGKATGGVIISVLLAAAIIAVIVYYITGGGSSTSGGGGMDPFDFVDETSGRVDEMNRTRQQLGEEMGRRTKREPSVRDAVVDGAYQEMASRAERDLADIATGIRAFHKDVGAWPIQSAADSEESVDYLFGNAGRLPSFGDGARNSWGTRSDNLHSYLVSNGPEKKGWTDYFKNVGGRFDGWVGPYLPREEMDPWGHAYLVSVSGFPDGSKSGNQVWCLSAGANGAVETPASASRTQGDDIGVLIR